jgi:hypothetical protein
MGMEDEGKKDQKCIKGRSRNGPTQKLTSQANVCECLDQCNPCLEHRAATAVQVHHHHHQKFATFVVVVVIIVSLDSEV